MVEVNSEGEEIISEDKQQHQNQTQNQPNLSDQHQHNREGGAHRATPSPPPLPPQASIPNEAASAQDAPDQTETASRSNRTIRQVEGLRSPQPLYSVDDRGGGGGKAGAVLPGVANLCPSSGDNDASCVAGATAAPSSHAVAAMAGISTSTGVGVGMGSGIGAQASAGGVGGGGVGGGGSVVHPTSARDTDRGYREGDWRQTSPQTSTSAFPENYVKASPPASFSGLAAGFVVEPSPPVSFSGLAGGGDGRVVSWEKEDAILAGAATTVPAMVVPTQGFHGEASYDAVAVAGDGDGGGGGGGGDVVGADAAAEWGAGGDRSREIGERECRSRGAKGPRDAFASDWMGSGTGGGW